MQDTGVPTQLQNQSYRPMTLGDWLITLIIAAIPLVGFIMYFVWAFGDGTHPSKKTWAQASLVLFAIIIVLTIVFVILFASVLGGLFSQYGNYST